MIDHSNRLILLANQRRLNGDTHGAIEVLKELLGTEPNHAIGHSLLAICLLDQKRITAAKYEAAIALELEPESDFSHYTQAMILLSDRQFRKAEEHIQQALTINPSDAEYHLALASVYQMTHQAELQKEALEKAISIAPDHPATHTALGEFYLDQGDLSQAYTNARQALELHPGYRDALVLMGHVKLAHNEIDEARDHAIWALQHSPTSSKPLFLLCAIKARTHFFTGLWWRFNTFLNRFGESKAILILLGMFMFYKTSTVVLDDFGYTGLANGVSIFWLVFVIYTWVSPALFQRSLKKELEEFQLRKDF